MYHETSKAKKCVLQEQCRSRGSKRGWDLGRRRVWLTAVVGGKEGKWYRPGKNSPEGEGTGAAETRTLGMVRSALVEWVQVQKPDNLGVYGYIKATKCWKEKHTDQVWHSIQPLVLKHSWAPPPPEILVQ